MKDRAQRRADNERLKKKRKHYWRSHNQPDLDERQVGMALHTPALCSCWMCGHCRKHEGRTIQELRNMQDDES